MRSSIPQLCLWAALLCCGMRVHVAADTIVIEKVTCQRVATGIDDIFKVGAQLLGALYNAREPLTQAGATLMENGAAAIGELPLTAKEVYDAFNEGWEQGDEAVEFIDKVTSGTDDLIININGDKIYPPNADHGSISAGETIQPNVPFDFDGNCRIQLIEYDWGSDNDNLGFIEVNDNVSPGKDYRVEDALVFNEDEGDLYKVTYRVERNDRGRDPKWMLCGTAACKECESDCCESDSNQGLDRDGDTEDIRSCPPGFSGRGWITYDLWWPADDVYLRICGNEYAGSGGCSRTVDVDGYYKRKMDSLADGYHKRKMAQKGTRKRQNVLREVLKMLENHHDQQ